VGEKLIGHLRLAYGNPEFSNLLEGYMADLRELFVLQALCQYAEKAMYARGRLTSGQHLLVRLYLLVLD
jgi:hypothetical protein